MRTVVRANSAVRQPAGGHRYSHDDQHGTPAVFDSRGLWISKAGFDTLWAHLVVAPATTELVLATGCLVEIPVVAGRSTPTLATPWWLSRCLLSVARKLGVFRHECG